jgi:hypothetical protein
MGPGFRQDDRRYYCTTSYKSAAPMLFSVRTAETMMTSIT